MSLLHSTNVFKANLSFNKIKSNTAGKPKEEILITSNCCKRLCMMSRTKKAEEFRTYFIEIEKLMNKYINYIIEALNKKVNILENNQKPIPNNKSGIIPFPSLSLQQSTRDEMSNNPYPMVNALVNPQIVHPRIIDSIPPMFSNPLLAR